jgi:hypothetical protein
LDRECEYKVKLSVILPIGIFLVVAVIVFAVVAYWNDRAIILNGMFLPRGAATVFYWLAAVGFGLTVTGMIYRVTLIQRIVLTSKGIVVPKSDWSSKEIVISYPMIAGIRELQERSPMLMILHRNGLAKICASRLPTAADYETIRQTLAEQVAAVQGE